MRKRFIITTIFLSLFISAVFFTITRQSGGAAEKTSAEAAARYAFQTDNTKSSDFYAENDAHEFRARFGSDAVKISGYDNKWKFDWKLQSIGRGAEQIRLETGETVKNGRRVEIEKSAAGNPRSKILTEWFENQPDGLEQGFIVYQKPQDNAENLRLVLTTDSLAEACDGGQSLELSDRKNGKIMRYEKLKVWDAENTILAAAMRVGAGGEILLEVEDSAAVYPVTIDPKFVQVQKINPPAGLTQGFGSSFAVSGDRMIVGTPDADSGRGSAILYDRIDGVWTRNPQNFALGDTDFGDNYGAEVAIDGDTIVITSPNRDSGRGGAFVFRHDGMSFNLVQPLTAQDGVDNHRFGTSVAIQGDTIIVGASGSDGTLEGAYVFRDPGIGAFLFRKKLVPSEPGDLDGFAQRISYSGNTVAVENVGGTSRPSPEGSDGRAIYIFAGSDANWTQQARITAPPSSEGFFGSSFDLDGDTLVVGETSGDLVGQAHIYGRNGTFWLLQQSITPSAQDATGEFGRKVAVSGNTIAVSDREIDNLEGAVFLYSGSGSNWMPRQKIKAEDTFSGQELGANIEIAGKSVFVTPNDADDSNRRPIYVFQLNPFVPADFDGDGKSDVSVFRPSNGVWYLRQSQNGFAYAQFGLSSDQLASADYDGDGRTDIAVFRPSDGVWYGIFSSSNTFESIQFGLNGDISRPGDYDADGIADIAVFRPSDGVWYRLNSSDGQFVAEAFGSSGDIPFPSDFDGDGITDKAIFRPSSGQWWIARSTLGTIVFTFGTGTDKPVAADYTGDGRADVAIFRPSSGEWFVLRSEDYSYYSFPFGSAGDIPSPADFDGDGRADPAVFRPGSGVWYIYQSQAGIAFVQFGSNGDKPVPLPPN